VSDAISIQDIISRNTAVQGIHHIKGIDKFFAPPWTFQVIIKNKDKARTLMTSNLPEFVTSIDIMMEDELDKFPSKLPDCRISQIPKYCSTVAD
jgi:hypothetical protein